MGGGDARQCFVERGANYTALLRFAHLGAWSPPCQVSRKYKRALSAFARRCQCDDASRDENEGASASACGDRPKEDRNRRGGCLQERGHEQKPRGHQISITGTGSRAHGTNRRWVGVCCNETRAGAIYSARNRGVSEHVIVAGFDRVSHLVSWLGP